MIQGLFYVFASAAPEEDHGIKCKYMRAAHGYLGNTTFHGISWVTTDVSKSVKVKVLISKQKTFL